MDRTGSLGANVHPLEHAVRITFDSSPATAKVVQAHATFKRTVLVPDEHGYLPKKLYQPQFWLVKLTVPKGLPLQKGTGVHDVKLRPDGRQFGSDGCKDALKEISSISLEGCHYAAGGNKRLNMQRQVARRSRGRHLAPMELQPLSPWVTTTHLLRRVCEDFTSRFVSHSSTTHEHNAWSWSGEPEALLGTDSIKIVQLYMSYSLQSVMVVLANHPGHLVRDIGEDSMITAIGERMKDLRGWVYDRRFGEVS
ncbi:hypothetical protein BDY19DRAFT_991956 [Irpex rosettiformis]|uniref:Uncharacterized protein n=1 Tax=Irpex rosettiformis TaxID=378272 RepID=A0ACB8U8E8_9APHY|nr:hypothetical protein BDY19DRAFT_991956 [Irpex rosettiformis]